MSALRLWSLHPRYLDSRGLVALWREALLARAVLAGKTQGYRHHPQLARFRQHPSPTAAIGDYLFFLWVEAQKRGFNFDRTKTDPWARAKPLPVTSGQLIFEWNHLQNKLIQRRTFKIFVLRPEELPEVHPLFYPVPGVREDWEKDQGIT
jgi:hypothetical protein